MRKKITAYMTHTNSDPSEPSGEAYIYLFDSAKGYRGVSKRQAVVEARDPDGNQTGTIILDFDSEGRLIGIEALEAASVLSRELLEQFFADENQTT